MDNLWLKKYNYTNIGLPYINVQHILVVTFEFTGEARGLTASLFMVRRVK